MKLIVAVIHPEQLGRVQVALAKLGLQQFTVSAVLVHTTEARHPLIYRTTIIREQTVPRLKLEIVVADERVETAIDAIAAVAYVGEADPCAAGKVLVRPLDETLPVANIGRGNLALVV